MILLGKIKQDYRASKTELVQRDRNWYPALEEYKKAVVVLWKKRHTAKDMTKASKFAQENGYRVFEIAKGTEDPYVSVEKELLK